MNDARPPRPTRSISFALLLCLAAGLACENTRKGLEQDRRALSSAATKKASEAREALDQEVSAFKQETEKKLEDLESSLSRLGDEAEQGVSDSKAELKRQVEEKRRQLEALKGTSREQWEKAKKNLDDGVADVGKKIHRALDGVGDAVEKKLD